MFRKVAVPFHRDELDQLLAAANIEGISLKSLIRRTIATALRRGEFDDERPSEFKVSAVLFSSRKHRQLQWKDANGRKNTLSSGTSDPFTAAEAALRLKQLLDKNPDTARSEFKKLSRNMNRGPRCQTEGCESRPWEDGLCVHCIYRQKKSRKPSRNPNHAKEGDKRLVFVSRNPLRKEWVVKMPSHPLARTADGNYSGYVRLAVLVLENAGIKIAKGQRIVFKDGDTTNCDISNLLTGGSRRSYKCKRCQGTVIRWLSDLRYGRNVLCSKCAAKRRQERGCNENAMVKAS